MHRRMFLRTTFTTAVAGGLAAEGLSRPLAFAGPAGPLKIGFLGVAHSHASEKVKLTRESGDWKLIGICPEDDTLRREYEKVGTPIVSEAELLQQADVIAVESNVQDHARHARRALAAGKHVHLEKPPTDALADFRDLLTLAQERKVLLQMGYMWRHHPGINAALEAARQGWLGEVFQVRGVINTQIGPERRPQWARFKGGTLFELGSHLIDVLVRLLGRPSSVTASLKTHGPVADELADNTVAVFEFPKALGIISSATLHPNAGRQRAFEIYGTNGSAIVRPIEPPELSVDLAKAAGPYRAGVNVVPLPAYRRYVGDFAELAQAVRTGQSLAVTPEQDLLVHETLLRACGM